MKNLINSYFSVQTTQNKKQNPDPQHLHQTRLFVCGVGVGRGGNIFSRNQPRDTAIIAAVRSLRCVRLGNNVW